MDNILLSTSPHNLGQDVVQGLPLSIPIWFIQQGLPPFLTTVWINTKKQQQTVNV